MNKRIRNLIAGTAGMMMQHWGYIDGIAQDFPDGSILPLCFHNPEKRLFEQAVQWLIDHGYVFLTNEHLLERIKGDSGHKSKAAWISFDDGWRENIKQVIPTLIKYDVPATFFLITGPIGSDDGTFWWPLMKVNRHLLPIPYDELWKIPEAHRRKIVEEVVQQDHVHIPRQAMTVSEIQSLAALSQIAIGCHTVNHGISVNHSLAELLEEICHAQEMIYSWTGRKTCSFAYPRGAFDPRARNFLAQNGFSMAFTTEAAILDPRSFMDLDPFCIPRIPVPDSGSFNEILCHMLGIWQPIMHAIKRFCGLRSSEFIPGEKQKLQ